MTSIFCISLCRSINTRCVIDYKHVRTVISGLIIIIIIIFLTLTPVGLALLLYMNCRQRGESKAAGTRTIRDSLYLNATSGFCGHDTDLNNHTLIERIIFILFHPHYHIFTTVLQTLWMWHSQNNKHQCTLYLTDYLSKENLD